MLTSGRLFKHVREYCTLYSTTPVLNILSCVSYNEIDLSEVIRISSLMVRFTTYPCFLYKLPIFASCMYAFTSPTQLFGDSYNPAAMVLSIQHRGSESIHAEIVIQCLKFHRLCSLIIFPAAVSPIKYATIWGSVLKSASV